MPEEGGSMKEADSLPLDGVKVLDLSRVLAGPWSTQTLADLGADVWKVESPGSGDDTRSWLPPALEGESTYFLCANRSKRSIAVDFKQPEGQEILRRMAAAADIVVENFRIGTLERYGLDYVTLASVNPRLIYCSISGYGRNSERANEPGYDFAIQAESGLMSITGVPDGEPMKVGVAVVDILSGMNATQAILAALIKRGATGRGQHIDIALFDSAVAVLANVGSAYLAAGTVPKRYGNAHPTVAAYQTFATRDGTIALAAGNDRQFQILCRHVLNDPELAESPRFASNRNRIENREELETLLSRHFAADTSASWIARLRKHGVPVGKIQTVAEALAAPDLERRNMVITAEDAKFGQLKLIGSPLGMPVRPPTSPPRLGEHTDQLLAEILGATADEIAAWRHSKAVS